MPSPESEDKESGHQNLSTGNDHWRGVDPAIWSRETEGHKGFFPRLRSFLRRVMDDFFLPIFTSFFALSLGASLLLLATLIVAIYIGEAAYMGAMFVGMWAIIIIAGITILERTGIAKNFEDWNFSIRRIVALPLGFLAVLALLYLMTLLSTH
jgi:hypothetical protein